MDLIISSGYPSPFRNIAEELAASNANPPNWFPMTVDFRATAAHSGGAEEAASFEQLLDVIGKKKAGSITELGLIGHASPTSFALAGRAIPGNIRFDPKGLIHPDTISWTILIGSRPSGTDSRPTTRRIPQASRSSPATPGSGDALLEALSSAFQVTARDSRTRSGGVLWRPRADLSEVEHGMMVRGRRPTPHATCRSSVPTFEFGSRRRNWRLSADQRTFSIRRHTRTPTGTIELIVRFGRLGDLAWWGFRGLSEGVMPLSMIDTQAIRRRWNDVGSKLDERRRRLFAAGEVRAAGRGGLEAVAKITGYARSTLGRGLKQLDGGPFPAGRVRQPGGGRRSLARRDATLIEDLRRIVEPATLGDPVRPLLWVSKSHDKLAAALSEMGHKISATSMRRLLPTLGFSRQTNRKADEGSKHPDRDAQFEHINAHVVERQAAGSLSFRSIRRRRSWSATIRTAARIIVPRAILNA